MIKDTGNYSKCINGTAKGCEQCVKGRKLVLFVTGICPRSCYYCPLSEKKYQKDVIYANEKPINLEASQEDQIKEIIKEAKINQAKGAGITGGDPLSKLNRTIFFIKELKKEFKNHFHIHLYTSFDLVTKDVLKQLYESGLDEIRFHPSYEDDKLWNKINLVKEFDWDYGIEIPLVPNKEQETLKLIEYFSDKVKIINLNELEISDNNAQSLDNKELFTKDELSYGIKGSEELGDKILKLLDTKESIKNNNVKVHYCSAKLKDKVQMKNRILLRAKNVAKHYESINEDGMIIKAVIYLEDFKPGINYRSNIQEIKSDKKQFDSMIKILNDAKNTLEKNKIKIEIDDNKFRLITHMKYFKKDKNIEFMKKNNLCPAIVEEYPTYDAFEVDINFF